MNIRSQLKYSLVKQIIFRLDFDGIMESDAERIASDLRDTIYEAGYPEMDKRQENQIDVQIKMELNGSDNNNLAISNTNNSIVYVFKNEEKEVIEINKSFLTFTINIAEKYTSFDKYMDLIAQIVYAIKSGSKYFKPSRVGLRKINICFLKDIKTISNYFSTGTFDIKELVEHFKGQDVVASNTLSLLINDPYKINYIRNVQKGIVQDEQGEQETVYQLVVDIDAFMDATTDIIAALTDVEGIKGAVRGINEAVFEMFIKSLTDDFVDRIKKVAFEDENLDGVIINE